jgi:hypothetical protein
MVNGTVNQNAVPSKKGNKTMNRFWDFVGKFSSLITIIPFVGGIIIVILTYLDKFDNKLQFVSILTLLVLMLVICGMTLYRINEIRFPKKPRIIKAFDHPDTFIFYRGVWRKIPDWQTRDYLAHVLGFRPGEEDIEPVSPDFIRTMEVDAPLESIFTYSR